MESTNHCRILQRENHFDFPWSLWSLGNYCYGHVFNVFMKLTYICSILTINKIKKPTESFNTAKAMHVS